MDALLAQVEAAQAEVAEAAEHEVTIADVAAAAFVALETIVAILGEEKGQQVIDQFEARAAAFAESMEAEG